MYYICTRNTEQVWRRSLKDYNTKRENSSVGRARPCQGRGRGFEPRFSLYKYIKYQLLCLHNKMLEWWNW